MESIKGAPNIAPIPISSPALSLKNKIAIIGNILSGKAVPTAAKTLPVKFFDKSNLSPIYSILFVNNSAATSIRINPNAKIKISITI